MHVCTCLSVQLLINLCVKVSMCLCVHVQVYSIYIHLYICKYTDRHTYIYIYICAHSTHMYTLNVVMQNIHPPTTHSLCCLRRPSARRRHLGECGSQSSTGMLMIQQHAVHYIDIYFLDLDICIYIYIKAKHTNNQNIHGYKKSQEQ